MLEAWANTLVGYVVALGVQYLCFPWFDIELSFWQHNQMALIFMVASIARGYYLRRLFNAVYIRSQR